MTIDDIRRLRNAEPFQPFALCLLNGKVIPVPHAEQIALGGSRVVVGDPDRDHIDIVRLADITGHQPL